MKIRRIGRQRFYPNRERGLVCQNEMRQTQRRHKTVARMLAEQGSSLVEMALVSIVLLTLLFGVIEICMALYTYHFVSEAAREGTRYAIVRGSSCQFPSACPAAASDIQNYVENLGLPGINPAAMTVTTTWSPYPAGGTCTPSASCDNPGNMVQVTIQYKFPLSIPFIPANTITMTSSSQMIISQ